ncbi:MAG: ABC transporter substrate-binding protein [Anaerolineae bacterium]|nr:ABC transporter substrate-binding protein [Anaerolineae bacterium]
MIARHVRVLIYLLAMLAPVLPAGVYAAPSAQAVEQLRMGITGDESTLNPYTYVTGNPGWNMLLLQYDTLFQLDGNGVPQPWLATGATASDDGLTVILDLRDDVTWHDGEPFTAEDVKFTVDYFKQNTHGRFTRDLRPVESAEVTGDYQVVLTLTAPSPSLELGTLADVPILPQHVWSEIENPAEANLGIETNIGTGPYKLTQYEPDQFYTFEANADYWAGAPLVAELVFVRYADTTGSIAALQSAEVDMLVNSVPPEQASLLTGMGDIDVIQGPLFTTDMITYDMERAPFNQLAVRQAMSLAINRQDIIDTVYLGTGTVGNIGWTHPASVYYNSAISAEYNLDRATAMLDEAGIVDSDGDGIRELDGEPLSFEFLTPSNNALRIRIAELVREMLLAIGIDVQVAVVEQTTWEEAVWPEFDVNNGRNYDMSMWGWSAPVQADPVRISSLVHSDPAIGSLNLTGYSNEQIDALTEELSTTLDVDRQIELMHEIQAIIAEELPFIMLLYPDAVYAYRPAVFDNWLFMTGQGVFHKLSFLPGEARP